MEGKGEISSDSSAVMLELLHMEMVSLFGSLDHKECQVSTVTWLVESCRFLQSKLEQLGRRVGATMAEQMTKDIPRFKNELDVLVFVCKQFWQQAWHKPVDNLKTNHQVRAHVIIRIVTLITQDVYVLLDNNFKLLSKMSSTEQYKSQAALVS